MMFTNAAGFKDVFCIGISAAIEVATYEYDVLNYETYWH